VFCVIALFLLQMLLETQRTLDKTRQDNASLLLTTTSRPNPLCFLKTE